MSDNVIQRILSRPRPSATVMVRGESISIVPLSMTEDALVQEAAGPMPVAPLRPDPARGSLAPPVPDENDAEYRNGRTQWSLAMTACEAAVLLLRAGCAEIKWNAAEVRAMADRMREQMSIAEITEIVMAARGVAAEAKNSPN